MHTMLISLSGSRLIMTANEGVSYIQSFITKYKFETNQSLDQEELEGIINAIKIKELDNSFRSILTKLFVNDKKIFYQSINIHN